VCGAGFAIEIQLLVSFFAAAQKAQKKKERSETFSPTKKKQRRHIQLGIQVCV